MLVHDACVSCFAYSPPPYRPHFGSLIDLPGPKLKTTAPEPGPRAANSEDVQRDGVSLSDPVTQPSKDVDHIVEEKITPSQASDTNKAFVIGLHACLCIIYYTLLTL